MQEKLLKANFMVKYWYHVNQERARINIIARESQSKGPEWGFWACVKFTLLNFKVLYFTMMEWCEDAVTSSMNSLWHPKVFLQCIGCLFGAFPVQEMVSKFGTSQYKTTTWESNFYVINFYILKMPPSCSAQ